MYKIIEHCMTFGLGWFCFDRISAIISGSIICLWLIPGWELDSTHPHANYLPLYVCRKDSCSVDSVSEWEGSLGRWWDSCAAGGGWHCSISSQYTAVSDLFFTTLLFWGFPPKFSEKSDSCPVAGRWRGKNSSVSSVSSRGDWELAFSHWRQWERTPSARGHAPALWRHVPHLCRRESPKMTLGPASVLCVQWRHTRA